MKLAVSVLVSAVVASGCSLPEPKISEPSPAPGPQAAALPLFVMRDPGLQQVGGLAASRRNQALLWASRRKGGDAPVLEGVGFDGVTVSRLHVQGAQRVDWADLAIGPGPNGRSTIFIGDIGDRNRTRPEVTVYRVTEPLVPTGGDITDQAETLEFRLVGGARDCGALLRDPLSDRLYVIAKEYGRDAPVFAGDALAASGTHAELEPVAQLRLWTLKLATEESAVTAGDISVDGMRIALRTASAVIEWERDRNESVEKALSREPVRVFTLRDPLAGSVAYLPDASLMFAIGGRVMRVER
jgi:hypothetical protein